jgi:hypothetical protein
LSHAHAPGALAALENVAAEKARALLDVLRTLSAALFRLADRHHLGDELGIQLGLLT